MILKRVRHSLSNDDGMSTPMILGIFLVILICFAMLFQFFYATAIVHTVHESCSSVAESALVANAASSYQAKRDGYTGIWHLDNKNLNDATVYIDPAADLARRLNLVEDGTDGSTLVKTDNNKEVYSLREIQLSIENADFQESKTTTVSTISLILDLNLNFPLIDNYLVSVPIEVSATWNPKF